MAPSEDGVAVHDREPIAIGEAAEVRVNGLAVRNGPGVEFAALQGWREPDPAEPWVLAQPELRLDAGALVVIDLGPIKRADGWWYRVSSLPPTNENPGDRVLWEADGVAPINTRGWVAGTSNDDVWLAPAAFPDYSGFGAQSLAPLVAAYGDSHGSALDRSDGGPAYTSAPFQANGQLILEWAALWDASPTAAFCAFRAVLQPLGAEVVVQHVIGGFAERTAQYPGGEVGLGPNALESGEYVLEVWSDGCAYAITVWQSQA